MKLWSWEINSAASRKVWTFNYVESSELATWKWKRTWKWALKWDWEWEWEWERAEENTGGVEMRMGLCFFTAECSTFQFVCSSGAVSYTRVINDGIRRTTWNHFKTNVKNNSKCFPPSSLSIADGYLIVNTLLSRETELGRRGDGPLADWFATASHWADGKIESWTWRCSRLVSTDGRNECWVWTSIQWQSRVSDSTLVCELMVAFVFVTETDDMWSELQVANPNTSSRSPTGLTYILCILWHMNM